MKLIKRSLLTPSDSGGLSYKHSCFISGQLISLGNEYDYYNWNGESSGKRGQYTTMFRRIMCILNSLVNENKELKNKIKFFKEKEQKLEKEIEEKKKEEEYQSNKKKDQMISNSYCGIQPLIPYKILY